MISHVKYDEQESRNRRPSQLRDWLWERLRLASKKGRKERLASNEVEMHIGPSDTKKTAIAAHMRGRRSSERKKGAENVSAKAVGHRWAYARQNFHRAVNVKPAGAGRKPRKAPGSPPFVGMPWFGSSAAGIIGTAKANRPVPCPGCGNRLSFLHGAARAGSRSSRRPMFWRSIWQWLNKNHDGF